jgi:hypothetical protein
MTVTVSAVAVGAGVAGQATEGIAESRRWWDPGVTLVLDGIAEGHGLAMAIRSDLPLAAPHGHSGCGSRSSHLQDGGTQRYFAMTKTENGPFSLTKSELDCHRHSAVMLEARGHLA